MEKIKVNGKDYFIRYETEKYYLVSKKVNGSKFKIDKND